MASLAVFTFLLSPALAVGQAVGPQHLLNDDATFIFALAPVDYHTAVACYFDTGVQDFATCKVVSEADYSLTSGPAYYLSSGPREGLAAAQLSTGRVLVCIAYTLQPANCAIVTQAGTVLTPGSLASVSTSTAASLAIAPMGSDKAILCYADGADADKGKCRVLEVSGSSVTAGAELTVTASTTAYMAVAQLGTASAVVCFQVQPTPRDGYCTWLSASGSSLVKGSQQLAATDTSNEVTYIALVQLGGGKAILCYKKFSADCRALEDAGSSLTFGDAVVIDPVASHIALAPVVGGAVVCYHRVNTGTGECNMLTEAGMEVDKTHAQLLSSADIYDLSVAKLNASRALACYREADNADKGQCNAVDFVVTTTTTTSTHTISTTTSTTSSSNTETSTATTTSTSSTSTTTTLLVPAVSVSAVDFLDVDLGSGSLGGWVTWQPPGNTDKVEHYAVFLAPTVENNENTRERIGLDVPLGTNMLEIPLGTLVAGHVFVVVYTANVHGRQDTVPASVSIVDRYKPLVNVSSVNFVDVDIDGGEIAGDMSWLPPVDTSLVSEFRVYLTNGEHGERLELLPIVPIGTNALQLPSDSPLGNATHFLVVTSSPFSEAPWGVALPVDDIAVPTSSVRQLAFVDIDTQAGVVGGNISWLPPEDVSITEHFAVYFSHDVLGTGRRLMGTVAVGVPQLTIPSTSLLNSQYVLVYATNSVGEQREPSTAAISDAGLNFLDTDLHLGYIGGTISWVQGAGASPVRTRVFIAQGPDATQPRSELAASMTSVYIDWSAKLTLLMNAMDSGLKLLVDVVIQGYTGDVALQAGLRVLSAAAMQGLSQDKTTLGALPLPADLVLGPDPNPQSSSFEVSEGVPLGAYVHLHVAQDAADGTQALRVGAIQDRAAPLVGVSQVSFADQHFARRELAGSIRWLPPADTSRVTRYAVYLADAPGADLENATLVAEVPVHTTAAALAYGTTYLPWGLVITGNEDGFNETMRGTVRIKDLAAYGSTRTWLQSHLCTTNS